MLRQQVADKALMRVSVDGESRYVARATWEMEKAVVAEIAAGKKCRAATHGVHSGVTHRRADRRTE